MAESRVGGKNGSITFAGNMVGSGANFSRWSIRMSHPVDDDTSYSDTGTGSSHAGSGTYDYNLSAAGYLKKGASGAGPLIGNSTSNVYVGALTATADTGCSEAGTFVISGVTVDHAKRTGAAGISIEGVNDGDITETWATS